MLCQGALQRRSVTCSRAALGHNRYFCLSRSTFSKHAAARRRSQALGLLVPYRTLAKLQRQKNGENRRADSLELQEQDNALPHRRIRGRLSEIPH